MNSSVHPNRVFPLKCSNCGTENLDKNQFCNSCGKKLTTPQPQAAPAPKAGGLDKKWIIIGIAIALILVAGIFVVLSMPAAISGSTLPAASEVVHGTISTEAPTAGAQGSISAAGGTITVNQPGSPINGLKFQAPNGAYPNGQPVTISSAPITGQTFGSNFNPASPMIIIDAGKDYAEEPILVTIPVTIPADQFAMAFYYDAANQKLEGIPTASQDGTSITIATRHFSNIIVSMISFDTLTSIKKVDSGFRPGVDDWEFDNAGSILAPGGHCAGQSATMLWYYTAQRQMANAPALYGRYDNNGRDKTPLLPRDDTLGYRFASVMQKDTDQLKYWRNPGSIISNVSDSNTFKEFKYSMLMTGEPQFVGIKRVGGGHAIVCYEVSDTTLWIADPNYPGKERMITLNGTTLNPYTSGANSQDIKENGVRIYPTINYIAKSAFFSWPKLAAEYAKVQDGTIGEGAFPDYTLKIYVANDDGTTETFSAEGGKNRELKRFEVKGKKVLSIGGGGKFRIYTQDGKEVDTESLTLNEGNNIMAFEIYSPGYEWIGFDWVNLVYKPPVTTVPVTSATAPVNTCPGICQSWGDSAYIDQDKRGCICRGSPYDDTCFLVTLNGVWTDNVYCDNFGSVVVTHRTAYNPDIPT